MQRSLEGILGEKGVTTNTAEKYIKVHRILGLDLICAFSREAYRIYTQPNNQSSREIVKENEWKVKYKVIDGMDWYLEGPIKNIEDAEKYETPDPYLPSRAENLKEIVRLVKDDLAIAGIVGGPFTIGNLLFGFTNFMRSLYVAPNSVQMIMEKIAHWGTEFGKLSIDTGADIIWIPDDLGMSDGPFLSPPAFRKYVFPSMKKMVDAFKKRGVKVLLHCDGQIMPLIDDIVGMGFDGVHPIERKAGMSLETMKTKYGDKLTLVGNVDATTLLPYGTAEEVKQQVLECLKIAALGGGYILASDHSIHEGVKSANAKTMFEAARKYGKYPRIPA